MGVDQNEVPQALDGYHIKNELKSVVRSLILTHIHITNQSIKAIPMNQPNQITFGWEIQFVAPTGSQKLIANIDRPSSEPLPLNRKKT
jgi:hypothetical protein